MEVAVGEGGSGAEPEWSIGVIILWSFSFNFSQI